MTSSRARRLWAAVPAILAVWLGLRRWSFTVDDTFITLRYSWNFAHGAGLTFNPGEAVEGYSNPTWTLLLGLALAAGLPGLASAKALGLAAHAWTCGAVTWAGLVMGECKSEGPPPAEAALGPVAAGAMLAWSVPASDWAVLGLETSLYAALLALSAVAWVSPAPAAVWVGAAAAGLAGISRPEGPLQAALLGLGLVLVRSPSLHPRDLWRTGWKPALVVCAPVLAWAAFRWATYHDTVPNTFYHKGGGATLEAAWAYVRPLVRGESVFFAAALGGLLLTLVAEPRLGAALTLAAAGHVLFVAKVGGDWMANQRFAAPGLPIAALCASVGFALATARTRGRGLAATVVAGAGVLAALHADQAVGVRLRTAEDTQAFAPADRVPDTLRRGYSGSNNVVTAWVLARARDGQTFAYSEVGLVAFVHELRVLDLVGLCSRELAGATGLDTDGRVAWVQAARPEWLLLRPGGVPTIRQLRASAWLQAEYEVGPGPKSYLAARRKDVAPATVAEALRNVERAIARQPGFESFVRLADELRARVAAGEGDQPATTSLTD